MFGLKCGSMLKYDEQRSSQAFQNNLKTLYNVPVSPCDTQIRDRLDPLNPEYLRPAFKAVHQTLQQQGGLREYSFMEGYYLLNMDGTGMFSSSVIHCPHCCEKHKRNGELEYYQKCMEAVIVHPDKQVVLPLCPEPITREDGDKKNDCERNAGKRLLTKIKADHPFLEIYRSGRRIFFQWSSPRTLGFCWSTPLSLSLNRTTIRHYLNPFNNKCVWGISKNLKPQTKKVPDAFINLSTEYR